MINRGLFASFFSMITLLVHAQAWQPCNLAVNNNNTWGTDVCVHNGKLFAVNNSAGLQVSVDDGATWTVVNASVTSNGVDLYSTGNRLYSVLQNSGCSYIQYSTDDGATFQIDTAGLPVCYSGATTNPSTGGVAWTNHLMFSFAGPDWEFSRNTADPGWIDASYFDPNDCSEFTVKNDTCWAATNGATSNGVAWSVDGLNWTSPLSTGIPGFYVPTQIAWIGNKLLMMGHDAGAGNAGMDTILKYSNDYGLSFQEYNIKQYLDQSAFFSQTGKQPTLDIYTGYGKVYLALGNDVLETAPELIMSSDGGQTFSKDTVGFPNNVLGTNFQIKKMVFLNGWVFAQLSSGDLFRKQIATVGINESAAKTNIEIYPNPCTEFVTIKIENNLLQKSFSIYDQLGRLILNDKLTAASTSINVRSLPVGIYFIKLDGESTQGYKIIKQQ